MKTSDFEYSLPADRIAQRPISPRDSARLMVFDRNSGKTEHRIFRDLPDYLGKKDVLVLNETKVIPARLRAVKVPTGGRAEILLLRRVSNQTWEVMVGGKGIRLGSKLRVIDGPIAEVITKLSDSRRVIAFDSPILGLLETIGEMPTPPYIRAPLHENDEYQTVYAQSEGSVAAPTAGLHFTSQLLQRIETIGVDIARVTLHIGLDTFAPVTGQRPDEHPIHREWCTLSSRAAEKINRCEGRVIAVGTTSVRTLETAAMHSDQDQRVTAFEGMTDLFILPGHNFEGVDGLITNFHLPRTTLLMMISAFAGREQILELYEMAIAGGYRFYSFGDAMLIL